MFRPAGREGRKGIMTTGSGFDAQEADVTFLAYFLLGQGQEPELSFPAR